MKLTVLILVLTLSTAHGKGRGRCRGEDVQCLLTQRLILQLKEREPGARFKALQGLARQGPVAAAALASVQRLAIKDRAATIREMAIYTMVKIGPGSRSSVPVLIRATGDAAVKIRARAVRALASLGKLSTHAAAPLRRLAESDPDPGVRTLAISALVLISPAAGRTIEALATGLMDRDPKVRTATVKALAKIGPTTRSAFPALVQALEDKDDGVRMAAARSLASFGARAVPVLIEALKHKNPRSRWAAATALGQVGPAAAAAIPQLARVMRDREVQVRRVALWALTRLGPGVASVLEALAKVVTGDDDPGVRLGAVQVMVRLGEKARPARAALERALRDRDLKVRQAAAKALKILR